MTTRHSLICQHGDTIRHGLVIYSAERLRNTIVGSPRWLIRFTDGTAAHTQDGASIGFELTNFLSDSKPLDVAFTKAGRIRDMVVSS